MTIKEFIETAIEGGYGDVKNDVWQMDPNIYISPTKKQFLLNPHKLVLDPEAWKAVVKKKQSDLKELGFRVELKNISFIAQEYMIDMCIALCAGKTLEECIATL